VIPGPEPMKFRFLALLLAASTACAEDLYVTPAGGGAGNGSSWTDAFPGLAAVAWGQGAGKVGPGDTLWLAGGTYSTLLTIGASGTAGARIQIKRVKATDAGPAAAAGWNPAFDSQVVIDGPDQPTCILFTAGIGSFVTIDGRQESGIKCLLKDGRTGVEIDNTPGLFTDITFQYIEVAGPGPIEQTNDTRAFDLTISGTIANLHVSHCSAHHCDTTFQITRNTGLIVEYSRFYDAYAVNAAIYHPNTIIVDECIDGIFRFNQLYNIRVEGLFFQSGANDNVQIYGNLFSVGNVPPDNGRGIEFGSTASATNFRIYHNTFVGLPFLALRLNATSHAGTTVHNNIFYNTVAQLAGTTHDHNLFSGDFPEFEANGIAQAPDPFVDLAGGNFRLVATTGATRARNNGANLGSPFDVDFDGHIRGADGAWDIGAFEYTGGNGIPTITSEHAVIADYRRVFSYAIAASDAPTSFGLSGSLPPGLSFTPATGVIAGTPSLAGVYEVTIRAGNAAGTGAAILTLTVDRAAVSLAGVTAANKVYDGSPAAILSGTAALVGILPGDTVTMTGSVSARFVDANAGNGKPVTVSGLQLAGAHSANYVLLPPVVTATINRAPATVTLGNFRQDFDGAPKVVTVATSPPGLATSVTYAGDPTPPSDPGSYALVAIVTHPNFQGSSTGVLNIVGVVPPPPALTSTGAATATAGVPFTYFIRATQSPTHFAASGLPAGLTLDPATGTISGIPLAAGTSVVTLSASNAGGTATAPLSLLVIASGPASQTVSFPGPANPVIIGQPVNLTATASSGLAVAFSLVSGNAILIGPTLTVFDTNGAVIRATQPGSGSFTRASTELALTNVQSATPSQVFFGLMGEDSLAAATSPDNSSGTLYGYMSDLDEPLMLDLDIDPDGNFSTTTTTRVAAVPGPAGSRVIAAAPAIRTVRGRVWNGVLTGRIEELGRTFSARLQPPAGATVALAGAYVGAVTGSAQGNTYLIVGTGGETYALTVTPNLTTAGLGTVDAAGTFNIRTRKAATISGTASPTSNLLAGTVSIANQPATEFAGAGGSVTPLDRLANLSSRGQLGGPAGGETLIAGFCITGTSPRPMLLRVIGPGLAPFGVDSAHGDPRLRLLDVRGGLLAAVEDWSDRPELRTAANRVGAFPLVAGSRDAALLTTLPPGNYTMVVEGAGTGTVLAEVYDAGEGAAGAARNLTNISTRGFVRTGDGVIVSGLIVGGNVPARVLIRGIGPGLAAYGVPDVLANPVLTLYRGATVLARNDDWESPLAVSPQQAAASGPEIVAANAAAGAFALAPGSRDAALVIVLAPGPYTAILSGAGESTGAGLIEVYQLSSH
jgi:hypothetical protein